MAFNRSTYTGPNPNRKVVDGMADVSKEELADFRRQYGQDKTLRDLLNADRTGRPPSRSGRAADVSTALGRRASASSPSSQEVMDRIKRLPPSKSPEQERDEAKERTMDSLGMLASVAAGPAIGAAMKGARAMSGAKAAETGWRSRPPEGADPAKWQQIVKQIDDAYPGTVALPGGTTKEGLAKALAEDIGSASIGARSAPMRSAATTTSDTGRRFRPEQEMEAATSAMRGSVGRREVQEARTGRSQAAAAAKAEKPVLRTDKAKETPRSRTRDSDEDVEFKKGGKTKAYAKGGSVRGAGIAQRGVKKCRMV